MQLKGDNRDSHDDHTTGCNRPSVATIATTTARGHPWLKCCASALQVCASTSVLMILFSSSAIAISLSFQGLLNVHYAVVFAPACFLGSLLGACAWSWEAIICVSLA